MSLSVSDVNVEQYFFPILSVEANPSHDPEEENLTIFSVKERVIKMKEAQRFGMELTVGSNEEESTNPPYFFKVAAFGFFNVSSNDADPDEMESICRIVGRRILMGAAREQVASMTSRGPWDTVHLRAVAGVGNLSDPEANPSEE